MRLRGNDLTGMKPEYVVRRGLALVPEGRHIFTDLTVAENLQLGRTASRDRSTAARAVASMKELFPLLTTHANHRAGQLSGGQQQQLAIARAWWRNLTSSCWTSPAWGLRRRWFVMSST